MPASVPIVRPPVIGDEVRDGRAARYSGPQAASINTLSIHNKTT